MFIETQIYESLLQNWHQSLDEYAKCLCYPQYKSLLDPEKYLIYHRSLNSDVLWSVEDIENLTLVSWNITDTTRVITYYLTGQQYGAQDNLVV